jgi:hypothetical protein
LGRYRIRPEDSVERQGKQVERILTRAEEEEYIQNAPQPSGISPWLASKQVIGLAQSGRW